MTWRSRLQSWLGRAERPAPVPSFDPSADGWISWERRAPAGPSTEIEVMRAGWSSPWVCEVRNVPPAMNACGLYWRPATAGPMPGAVIGPLSTDDMQEFVEQRDRLLTPMDPPVTWEVRVRVLRPLDGVVGATVDVLRPDGIRTTGAGGAAEAQVVHVRGDVLAQQVEAVATGMMRDLDPAARDQFARLSLALARGVKRATMLASAFEAPAGKPPTREQLAWWIKTTASAVAAGTASADEVVDALLDVLADAQRLHVPVNAAASRSFLNPGGAAWAAGVDAIRAGA